MPRKNIIIPTRLPRIRIVNRCLYCGRIIPAGYFICDSCKRNRNIWVGRRR